MLEAKDQTRLRKQALDWLQADLEARSKILKKNPLVALLINKDMQHWRSDADLSGLRDEKELAMLSSEDRSACAKLWGEVKSLAKKAHASYTQTDHKGQLVAKQREQSHALKMTAGKTYVIDMESQQFDTLLRLLNHQGNKVAENDDISPTDLNSRIIFTPRDDGAYTIVATSFQQRGTGAYTITVSEFAAQKKSPEAELASGNLFAVQKKFREAEAAYREAIRLRSDYVEAHASLGKLLVIQKRLPEAEAAYREHLRLRPNDAEAYNVLFNVLNDQKKFAMALALSRDAFRVIPAAAADPYSWLRYNAACSAILAAAEKDAEAKEPTEAERVQLRAKALAWLREDLAAWGKRLDGGKAEDRSLVEARMRHWQQDTDFASVRGAESIAKLPETERAGWEKLWQEVEELRDRAAKRK